MIAAILMALPAAAQAAPLKVVEVGAPAINCVFDTNCKITVYDSIGAIPMPGISGAARLQSRSLVGAAGAPGAGKNVLQYRVDLTQAVGVGGTHCVSSFKLDFGAVAPLPYNNGAAPADVYVITSGGLGTIGLLAAEKTGNVITFLFAKPICAGTGASKGDTSYFFGLAAVGAPKAVTAQIQVTGGAFVNVPTRVPTH